MSLMFPFRRVSPLWRSAVEMMNEMERLDRGFVIPYWKNAEETLHVGNVVKEAVNDDQKFAISLDVSQFKPEELKINIEGKNLIIEGTQEQKNDTEYMKRSFHRQWTLPDDVNIEAIKSELSDKGYLSIEAPKTGQTGSRSIPIMPVSSS